MMQKLYDQTETDEFKKMVGRNIRLIRKVSGMTGEQFAQEAGIGRNHLSNLENGKAYSIVYSALQYLNSKTDLDNFFQEDLGTALTKTKLIGD